MSGTEKHKMLAGELYRVDSELQADQAAAAEWMDRYNRFAARDHAVSRALLVERFAQVGDGVVVRAQFQCDYGSNIVIGAGSFLNFGCVILDVVSVRIGARTQIGPLVQLYMADHPRDAGLRRDGLECGQPIVVGDDVWWLRDHPARRDDRRWCRDRSRQRGHMRRGCRSDRSRQSRATRVTHGLSALRFRRTAKPRRHGRRSAYQSD